MKKLLPLLIIAIVVGGLWLFASEGKDPIKVPVSSSPSGEAAPSNGEGMGDSGSLSGAPGNTTPGVEGGAVSLTDTDGSEETVELKPATEAYDSAEAALAAVLKGAKEYDDSILEQFTQPGDDCTWCPAFYTSVRDLALNSDTPSDQKSYLSEILAISGRLENVQSLTEAVKNAKSPDEADVFAQALELTVGKEDVTRYLGDQMNSSSESLREASVAAVTNQGSLLATELLIKNTIERGDPDGYYSSGIGLGEMIPSEEAMPALQQLVQKRDDYSHLGVKALLNSGMDGMRMVFDELENSKDPAADAKLMKDAIDHVNYEDGILEYVRDKAQNSKNPTLVDFAKKIEEGYEQASQEDGADVEVGDDAADENEPVQTLAKPEP